MTSMTEETTYNGWKNYPTWAVNLWLSNDEPLYREALYRTQAEMVDPSHTSEHWDAEQTARFNVADMLKDWVTDELAPDLGASFASDLLGYALGEVNWEEIADSWIEQVNEQS